MNPLQAHLIALLHELAHGPEITPASGAAYGHFSERGSGLLPTLRRLNAAQASTSVHAAPARPPLAALVGHLSQLLTFASGQLNGVMDFPDFAAPWQIGTVNAEDWTAMQTELAQAFAAVRASLEVRELDSEELNVAQTALTHAAYHAGAIRSQALNLLAVSGGAGA
jgi:hypothetical protein